MKGLSKILGIIILVGLVMSVVAFFTGLDPMNLRAFFTDEDAFSEMLTETTDKQITSLNMELQTRDITVHYVEESQIRVTYYAKIDKDTWTFDDSVDGVYSIIQKEKYEWFSFNFKFTPSELRQVNVYIPSDWILAYDLSTNTGSIKLQFESEKMTDTVTLHSDTGSIYLDYVHAETLDLQTDTGSVIIRDTTSESWIKADSDTGGVVLTDVDGTDMTLTTNTGSVTLTNVSGNVLDCDVDTGRISITDSTFTSTVTLKTDTGDVTINEVVGTSFDIKSSTGDVRVTMSDTSSLRYDLETDTGNIKIDGQDQGDRHSTSSGTIMFKVDVNTGNIRINS